MLRPAVKSQIHRLRLSRALACAWQCAEPAAAGRDLLARCEGEVMSRLGGSAALAVLSLDVDAGSAIPAHGPRYAITPWS
jgi:hypothetical protein